MKKRRRILEDFAMYCSLLVGLCFYTCMIAIFLTKLQYYSIIASILTAIILVTSVAMATCAIYRIIMAIADLVVKEKKCSKPEFLKLDEFTSIFHKMQKNPSQSTLVIIALQKKGEIKFFAKLLEDQSILLVVKNKENKEIYSCKITNYSYFNELFTSN